ncbi:MAG: hypothetical protein A3H97_14665 [Acidobacteria bacterium RIFCSPLOWO2_02_FULL_65_29]|nr:MAG: hypothetical protein A3H97_14665 [Acidobacteria bacterium RIFCSPLOWO2_02_FULL_65_29]
MMCTGMNRFTSLIVPWGLLSCWVPAAVAQAQAVSGQMNMADHRGGISGTVRNAGGLAVAGATVMSRNAEDGAQAQALPPAMPGMQDAERQALLDRIAALERRIAELEARGTAPQPGTSPVAGASADGSLAERLVSLERRLTDLESSTVLSEPETRVRQVEVWVDADGVEHDQPVPGARRVITYQRERVYRRQTINEKLGEAIEDAENRRVRIGVDSTIVPQGARRTEGSDTRTTGDVFALASADLFFTAGLAQYTVFFADIVGLSGSPPDAEIPSLSLINGYTARLVRQNELSLREAWLRTELFGQRLALSAGRLDLTNYFDQNAFANDESTQFLSDALVNNQMLGLAVNGTGLAAELDAKTGLRLKFGLQQSNTDAPNLSDSIFTLSEVGYTMTPFALPEGNYRLWFRTDNSTGSRATAVGVSLDQKLTPIVGLFGRYGSTDVEGGRDHQYSFGVGFQNGLVFSPRDTWGIGYSQLTLAAGEQEKLTEGYYNVQLTERLRFSFHLQHVFESPLSESSFGYLLPGVRLQAAF